MDFSIQPLLKNEMAEILPLRADHFDLVYQAASDPQVWEQHPNRNRYQKEVFKVYFEGAIESKGAFMIKDILTGEIAGCTRFYNYDPEKKMILIGYTFYAKKYWGTGLNHAVKKSMLDYIFQYVDPDFITKFHLFLQQSDSQYVVKYSKLIWVAWTPKMPIFGHVFKKKEK